jgi:hypothetical protein
MALLWADGFDHYGNSANFVASGVYVYKTNDQSQPLQIGTDPDYIRTGNHYWNASGQIFLNWYGGKLTENATIMGAGAAFFFAGPPVGDNYCPFMFCSDDKDTFQASVRLNPNGSLSACSAKDGAVFGTSNPGVISYGSYGYIEAKVICDAVNGAITIRVNEQTVLEVEGVDTDPVGSGYMSGVMCGTRGLNSSAGAAICQAISDFVIWSGDGAHNTAFLGDVRCRTIYPAANGGAQDWAHTGGATAWQSINNVPALPGDEFISAADPGDISTFGLQSIPTNTSAVFGVNLVMQLNKDSAGTCTVSAGIDSNGDVTEIPDINPGTGNAYYSGIIETDPQGGGNFNYGRINALLARVERTA